MNATDAERLTKSANILLEDGEDKKKRNSNQQGRKKSDKPGSANRSEDDIDPLQLARAFVAEHEAKQQVGYSKAAENHRNDANWRGIVQDARTNLAGESLAHGHQIEYKPTLQDRIRGQASFETWDMDNFSKLLSSTHNPLKDDNGYRKLHHAINYCKEHEQSAGTRFAGSTGKESCLATVRQYESSGIPRFDNPPDDVRTALSASSLVVYGNEVSTFRQGLGPPPAREFASTPDDSQKVIIWKEERNLAGERCFRADDSTGTVINEFPPSGFVQLQTEFGRHCWLDVSQNTISWTAPPSERHVQTETLDGLRDDGIDVHQTPARPEPSPEEQERFQQAMEQAHWAQQIQQQQRIQNQRSQAIQKERWAQLMYQQERFLVMQSQFRAHQVLQQQLQAQVHQTVQWLQEQPQEGENQQQQVQNPQDPLEEQKKVEEQTKQQKFPLVGYGELKQQPEKIQNTRHMQQERAQESKMSEQQTKQSQMLESKFVQDQQRERNKLAFPDQTQQQGFDVIKERQRLQKHLDEQYKLSLLEQQQKIKQMIDDCRSVGHTALNREQHNALKYIQQAKMF